jgi:N-acetylglutamate synthase-like GNAT family acetyltransferase
MGMHIREASPLDARAIEGLYKSFVSNPAIDVRADRVEEIRSDPCNFLLVVENAGQLVGTAFFTVCRDPMFAFRPYAVVENVVVAEGQRRKGIGRRLLEHVEGIATRLECTKIMLLSSSYRTAAHTFFAQVGFNADKKRGFVKYLPRTPTPSAPSGERSGVHRRSSEPLGGRSRRSHETGGTGNAISVHPTKHNTCDRAFTQPLSVPQ